MTLLNAVPANAVQPVTPSNGTLQPLALTNVTIDGGFWGDRQDINHSTILKHAYGWMKKLGWVQNLVNAAGDKPYEHHGKQFADSEVFKLIEAISWSIYKRPDPELQAILDELIDVSVAAQDPDGYLHSLFGRRWQAPRYSDFQWGHEMYCFGHYIQAAVANYRATGATKLLDSAKRLADHVCTMFGVDGINMVCGHPEIEVALVELYRATGEQKYLDQANVFIDRRGTGTLPPHEFGPDYWQDATPVRDQDVFVGHSVRALYLAAGAVDAAVESDDSELLDAVARQWDRTIERRTYITGGMGSHHMDEAFGDDFVLPPDRAYCETCAGVAALMVGWRLLLAKGDAKYGDAIERVLFNIVATGPSADGTAFFYANTLHQRKESGVAAITEDGVPIRGGALGRQEWFEVSCCPPNVARTFGSLDSYIATTDDEGVQIHQFAPATIEAEVNGAAVRLTVETEYPSNGTVNISVLEAPESGFQLRIRVPAWAQGAQLIVDGVSQQVQAGTYAQATVAAGAAVTLELPVSMRVTRPDFRIDAVRGTVAFERGPEVLALESVDLPADWSVDSVATTGEVQESDDGTLLVELQKVDVRSEDWAYAEAAPAVPTEDKQFVPLVRYHEWAERGPSTMRIFIPTI